MNKRLAPPAGKEQATDLVEVNGRFVEAGGRSVAGAHLKAFAVTVLRCLGMAFRPFWVRHLPAILDPSWAPLAASISVLFMTAALALQHLLTPQSSSLWHALNLALMVALIGLITPRLGVAYMAISTVSDAVRVAIELAWGAAPAVAPITARWPFAAWEWTALAACALVMAFEFHQRLRAQSSR